MRLERLILYVVPGLAGLAAFLLWRWLVGPSLHWVESLVGLALAIAAFVALFRFLRRRLGH